MPRMIDPLERTGVVGLSKKVNASAARKSKQLRGAESLKAELRTLLVADTSSLSNHQSRRAYNKKKLFSR